MYIVFRGTSGLSPDELASLDDSNLLKACTNLQHASKSYEICENVGKNYSSIFRSSQWLPSCCLVTKTPNKFLIEKNSTIWYNTHVQLIMLTYGPMVGVNSNLWSLGGGPRSQGLAFSALPSSGAPSVGTGSQGGVADVFGVPRGH